MCPLLCFRQLSERRFFSPGVLFQMGKLNLPKTISFFFPGYCALFEIFTVKLILMPKNGPGVCKFYYKLDLSIYIFIYFFFLAFFFFLLFLTVYRLLNFNNNMVKIYDIFNKWKLLKTYI